MSSIIVTKIASIIEYMYQNNYDEKSFLDLNESMFSLESLIYMLQCKREIALVSTNLEFALV